MGNSPTKAENDIAAFIAELQRDRRDKLERDGREERLQVALIEERRQQVAMMDLRREKLEFEQRAVDKMMRQRQREQEAKVELERERIKAEAKLDRERLVMEMDLRRQESSMFYISIVVIFVGFIIYLSKSSFS